MHASVHTCAYVCVHTCVLAHKHMTTRAHIKCGGGGGGGGMHMSIYNITNANHVVKQVFYASV